jgi:hypothetical protein
LMMIMDIRTRHDDVGGAGGSAYVVYVHLDRGGLSVCDDPPPKVCLFSMGSATSDPHVLGTGARARARKSRRLLRDETGRDAHAEVVYVGRQCLGRGTPRGGAESEGRRRRLEQGRTTAPVVVVMVVVEVAAAGGRADGAT